MSDRMKAYARAGVDVDLGNSVKSDLPKLLQTAHRPEVLGKVGGFGGLFSASFPKMRDPVLVASIDGVGTKIKVAVLMNRHDTIGEDLVNHCVNEIAVLGAEPLFFLDYYATGKLDAKVAASVVSGIARGCEHNKCALIGGETAEMPGLYAKGDFDLAGFAVGAAVRASSGRIFVGCNVENAAYPAGTCAEEAAIAALVAAGERRIVEALVTADSSQPVTPCGACRQRLREFAVDDAPIHAADSTRIVATFALGALLPHSFGPSHLPNAVREIDP